MKENILVGQSSGPTAIINADLYGVIVKGMARPEGVDRVYGMVNGIKGFFSGHVTDLSLLTCEDFNPLKQTPAAYLGPYRFKLPENLDAPVCSSLSEKFTVMNTGACFYIGGSDSVDTVDKLSRYARIHHKTISFIGVPETISNDLPAADHIPGYGNAAKYVASTVCEISLDASMCQQSVITIAELMGRHVGWVAAISTLTRKHPGDNPLLIYTPEVPFSTEQFLKDIERALPRQSSVAICVFEDIRDRKGRFVCEYANDAQIDTSGHKMFIGCAKILESYVRSRFRVKVRSVELNVDQHCSSLLVSVVSIKEAECSGRRAVEKTLQGETGKMVTYSRLSGPGYELEYGLTEVSNVCNRGRSPPAEQVTVEGSDIGPEFLDYTLPLI